MSDYKFDRVLTRAIQRVIDHTPIEDGKLRFATDTGRLFVDFGSTTRIEIADFNKDYLESEIFRIENPTSKIYMARDTKRLYVFDDDWVCVSDNVSRAENAGTAQYSYRAQADQYGNSIIATYATLHSPAFYGNPSTPNPDGSSETQITNVSFVKQYVAEVYSNITNGLIIVRDELPNPEEAEPGKLYFIPAEREGEYNIFKEYIWSPTLESFEKLGVADINLAGYYKDLDHDGDGNAITSVEYDEETDKLLFHKQKTFLTEHPAIVSNSSTTASNPLAGANINVIDNVVLDQNGHITSYRVNTVTLPTNVGTANYAENVDWTSVSNRPTAISYFNNDSKYLKKEDTINNAGTATYATNAGTANQATNASTANYAASAGSISWDNISNKPTAISGSSMYADNAGTASYASSAAGLADNTDLDFGELS